jgi:hypothetical protein
MLAADRVAAVGRIKELKELAVIDLAVNSVGRSY